MKLQQSEQSEEQSDETQERKMSAVLVLLLSAVGHVEVVVCDNTG